MFFQRKKRAGIAYDPATQRPAVRRSICTGEMTVGFIDRATGRFSELMRVDDRKGLEDFCRAVGVETDELETIY